MKYDDASWHSGGDFPEGLPPEAGATHIAMFLTWAVLNGLGGEVHTEDFADQLENIRERKISPRAYLLSCCDGKLTDEDLGEEGNAFAMSYYQGESFFEDIERIADGLPSSYELPDTWETYDKLKPIIDSRFCSWRENRG